MADNQQTRMDNTYEQWLAFLSAELPQPVTRDDAADGAVYMVGGEPAEVLVRLTGTTVTVLEYAPRRNEAGHYAIHPRRMGTVAWRRMSQSRGMAAVRTLIAAAQESRRSRYLTCFVCEKRTAPERMRDEEICMACARLEHPAGRT